MPIVAWLIQLLLLLNFRSPQRKIYSKKTLFSDVSMWLLYVSTKNKSCVFCVLMAHLAAWKNDKTRTLWFVFVHIKESGHKLITVANKSMFSQATFLVLLFLHENVRTGNTEIISAFKQCLRQKSDRRCVTCYWQRSLYISCWMGAGVYNAYCYDHSSYLCYTWYRTCGVLATSLLWV